MMLHSIFQTKKNLMPTRSQLILDPAPCCASELNLRTNHQLRQEMKMKVNIIGLITTLILGCRVFAVSPTEGLPEGVAKLHLAMAQEECSLNSFEGPGIHDLGKGKSLYLVPCYFGAYQGSSRGYIKDGSLIFPVIVLSYDETTKAVVGTLDLGSVEYDEKTKTLSTHAKGRGLGDCGQSSVSKISVDEYGGYAVRTIQIRAKLNCDGKYTKWPIVFKQK